MAAVSLTSLLADLADEHDSLDDIVAGLAASDWDAPTPAAGWAVRDQVSHLAFFDEVAALAIHDPGAFAVLAERATTAMAAGDDPMAEHLARGREMPPAQLLGWWRDARAQVIDAARAIEPAGRVAWFGPAMSPMSFFSARLMETWAHGQDVVDAVGAWREPTDRLAHVALIGVRARAFSYMVRGMEVPETAVRVDLESPSGERWEWDADAADAVSGTALDFCLVTTQRRHLSDTALDARGESAAQWMSIAQAFAGPPGPGRPPSPPS